MATLILSGSVEPRPCVVQEDFETAIEKVFPIQAHSSSLVARAASIWMLEDGRRAMIPSQIILSVEESEENG